MGWKYHKLITLDLRIGANRLGPLVGKGPAPEPLAGHPGPLAGPWTPGRPPWTPGRPLNPWPATLDPWPAPEPLAGHPGPLAGPWTPGRPPWTPGRPLNPWPATLAPWPAPEPLAVHISRQADSMESDPYKEKRTVPGTPADVTWFACVTALDSHEETCTHEAVRGSPGLTGNSARCPVTACDSRTAPLRLFWDSLKLQCLNKIGQQIAVGIWVSYVTSCYVTSCSVCPGSSVTLEGGGGSGGGGGGEWGRGGGSGGGGGGKQWGCCGGQESDSFSLVFENSIVLIKCTLYDTVFQR